MSSLARGHAGVSSTVRVTACEPSLLDVRWGWRHATASSVV